MRWPLVFKTDAPTAFWGPWWRFGHFIQKTGNHDVWLYTGAPRVFSVKTRKTLGFFVYTSSRKRGRVYPYRAARFHPGKKPLCVFHTLSYESFWSSNQTAYKLSTGTARPQGAPLWPRVVGGTLRRMETLDYWTPADALAFRCSVEQVGTLKPREVAQPGNPGLRDDVAEARLYAPRALRALARVMEEGTGRAAVEAAREVLARAYGAPLQPLPPAPPPALPQSEEWPEWLTAQRLAHAYTPRLRDD